MHYLLAVHLLQHRFQTFQICSQYWQIQNFEHFLDTAAVLPLLEGGRPRMIRAACVCTLASPEANSSVQEYDMLKPMFPPTYRRIAG